MFMSLLKRLLPNSYVQKKYIEAGKSVGEEVSYLFTEESIGFNDLLKIWEKWEKEYASRGFRTIDLHRFTRFGGFDESIKDVIGKKRREKEEPIYHAKIYREKYPEKTKSELYTSDTPLID
jgi:hypothetical protein